MITDNYTGELFQKLYHETDESALVTIIDEIFRELDKVKDRGGLDAIPGLQHLSDKALSINYFNAHAKARANIGIALYHGCKYNESIAVLKESLPLIQQTPYRDVEAHMYHVLGWAEERIDNVFNSLLQHLKALEIYMQTGNEAGLARVTNSVGDGYTYIGDLQNGLAYNLRALQLFERLNDNFNVGVVLHSIANIYIDLEQYDDALAFQQRSLQKVMEINDVEGAAFSYHNLGRIYGKLLDFERSQENFSKAIELFGQLGWTNRVANSYYYRGEASFEEGDYSSTENHFQKALQLIEAKEEFTTECICFNGLGKLFLNLGQIDKAKQYYTWAYELSATNNIYTLKLGSLEGLYLTNKAGGNKTEALDFLEKLMVGKDELAKFENTQKVAALQFSFELEKKEKEAEIERLRNVELKNALEGLKFEKERSEQLLGNQLSELKRTALQAQMNPHFVFNSLNAIQRYIWKSDPEKATDYLVSFAKLIRLVLENSRKLHVSIERDLEALEHYIQLEALRFENPFSYTIICDPSIDKREVEIPPMIIQPFVENAIIHGMHPGKKAGVLSITLEMENDATLKVSIRDNGVGRVKSGALNSSAQLTPHQSLGLEVTQERLSKMNGLPGGKVNVIDLYDNLHEPLGTLVEIQIPL